jgi:hypothetical protein
LMAYFCVWWLIFGACRRLLSHFKRWLNFPGLKPDSRQRESVEVFISPEGSLTRPARQTLAHITLQAPPRAPSNLAQREEEMDAHL